MIEESLLLNGIMASHYTSITFYLWNKVTVVSFVRDPQRTSKQTCALTTTIILGKSGDFSVSTVTSELLDDTETPEYLKGLFSTYPKEQGYTYLMHIE